MVCKGNILMILFILTLCIGSVYAPTIPDLPDQASDLAKAKIDNLTEMVTNKTLKDGLRSKGYKDLSNGGVGASQRYISYNASRKGLHVEDHKHDSLIEIELISDYTTYVYAGDDVKVAEFLLIDYDDSISMFDCVYSFDKKNDYDYIEKNYTLRYGVDSEVEVCQDLPDYDGNVTYCYNTTETNWTDFDTLSDLPHKDIRIGLFTDTVLGDNIEWVPTIMGFDILEWADWDVTSGTKHEFDTEYCTKNSLVKINETHYINAYSGSLFDGYAVVLVVNTTDWTITSGTKHEFDIINGDYNSLVKINDTHYLNTYRGADFDGFAVVLTVDLDALTITSGTKHEFDTVYGVSHSLVKINDTHYINTYGGLDNDGYAVVLVVNTTDWTIDNSTKHEFDTDEGLDNSLVKINDTHYLNTYRGADSDGFAVVLTVDLDALTITSGTKHEFDTIAGFYNSLVQINETHYINAYSGYNTNGHAVVLVVNTTDWTITSGTKHEFDTATIAHNSLVKINDTYYLNAYTGADYDGYAVVLTVDLDALTITSGTKHEFDTDSGSHTSLVQIDSSHYLNTYRGAGNDGYAIVLTAEPDTTSPTYSQNSTNSTLAGFDILHALKWEDGVALDTYIFSFDNGTGSLTNDSLVDISGTSHWSNVTKGINHTVGTIIRWQVFANDTSNNWNETPIYSYTAIAMPIITANVSDPATVYTNTDWEINVTVTDEDSATMTGYAQFYINGTSYSTIQSQAINNDTNTLIATLGYANFLKDYNLTAETWVGDGTTNTSKTNLTVTVSNSIPTTTTPTLSPTIGYKNVTLITCDNATVSDADNDSITWYYQWHINGSESVTTKTIPNTDYFKDDQLICEIWADDTFDNSTKYNSTTMTIKNSRPVISNVVIVPSPAEVSDNLNATYTYYDIDGDSEANTYFQWYINSIENESVRYLTSGNTTVNDNIIISIKADDGNLNSTWLNSTTLTIGDNTDPILHTHYMSGTSGYTNVAFTIGVNMTEHNTIDWIKVEINDPNDDKTNYTMALSQTNGTEHHYIKSYTPTIVGQYDFYFYGQDGSGNHDSLNGTQYYTASTAPATPTGGGGGGTDITIIVQPAMTNMTTIYPDAVFDTVAVGSTKRKELRIDNLDLTPTTYHISFSCEDHGSKLCEYLEFYNPADNQRTDNITIQIPQINHGFLNYYVTVPDDLPLSTYYADIIITSDKGEVLIVPLEYETMERFSIIDIISQLPLFGEWLASVIYSFEYGTDMVTSTTDEGQLVTVSDFRTLDIYNLHVVFIIVLGMGIYLYSKENNMFHRQYKIFRG